MSSDHVFLVHNNCVSALARAEVDETTFVLKRELAALRQHDLETNMRLEQALSK